MTPLLEQWRNGGLWRRLVIAQAIVVAMWATLALINAVFRLWLWFAVDVFALLVCIGFLYRNVLMERDYGPNRKTRPQVDNDPSDRTRSSNSGADAVPTPDSSRTEPTTDDAEERTRSGLSVGEVYAWRAWICAGPYLASFMGQIWIPGEPIEARETLELDNTSGVHSFKSVADAQAYCCGKEPRAVGRVKLWGTIVEHETGYRAQFAKPVELVTAENGADFAAIKRLYNLEGEQ